MGLQISLVMTAGFTCSGPGSSVQAIGALQVGANQIETSSNACNSALHSTKTLLIQTAVGDTLQVIGQLNLNAQGDALINEGVSTATVDPPSSAFYIDSETPGASYTTESGVEYFSPSAPTPEPSSVILFSSGLFSLFLLLRKK